MVLGKRVLSSESQTRGDRSFRGTFAASLRRGSWITAERVRLYSLVILIASIVELPFLFFVGAHAPFGADFVVTWAADRAAMSGADFYDASLTLATDRAVTGLPDFFPFPYPPTYALITAPLGRLPYHVALVLWLAAGLACFVGSLLLVTEGRGLLPILAFPAVVINIVNGQNGLLFASLFAGALGLLKRRPIVAGVLIGLLAMKPHLGILFPFALAGGKEWRAFVAAALTVAGLVLASMLAFGITPWLEFLRLSEAYRTQLLVADAPILAKIVTIFATALRWGFSSLVAYAVQVVVLIACAGFVFLVWRSPVSAWVKQAALAFAALLATPYLFDYDLAILAIGIAALAVAGLEESFLSWETLILVILWLLPGVARPVTMFSNIPIVPLVVLLGTAFLAAHMRHQPVESLCPQP
jgi:alpha-1,2-mannosyltransferase